MKKGLCQKGRSKIQAQTPTSKTTVEERTNFKHREVNLRPLFLFKEQGAFSKFLLSQSREESYTPGLCSYCLVTGVGTGDAICLLLLLDILITLQASRH